MNKGKQVILYTDGACSGNPGPGGYAYKLVYNKSEKTGSDGYRLTTNNRMELRAVLEGLRQLKRHCEVIIYSDSKYICNTVEQNWLNNWKRNGWRTKANKAVKNIDLWKEIDILLNKHNVKFEWVKGHSGHPENELCDMLAVSASQKPYLLEDENYLE